MLIDYITLVHTRNLVPTWLAYIVIQDNFLDHLQLRRLVLITYCVEIALPDKKNEPKHDIPTIKSLGIRNPTSNSIPITSKIFGVKYLSTFCVAIARPDKKHDHKLDTVCLHFNLWKLLDPLSESVIRSLCTVRNCLSSVEIDTEQQIKNCFSMKNIEKCSHDRELCVNTHKTHIYVWVELLNSDNERNVNAQ